MGICLYSSGAGFQNSFSTILAGARWVNYITINFGYIMSRSCIICGDNLRPFFSKNNYVLKRCPACGHSCVSLDEDYYSFVDRYYRKGYFTGEESRVAYENYENDKPYIQANMRKFLQILHGMKPSGKLLDVGCALGFFVELSKDKATMHSESILLIMQSKRQKIGWCLACAKVYSFERFQASKNI